MTEQRVPLGIKLLVAFFAFGAAMSLLTTVMLIFPGSTLDSLWRLNPDAHDSFQYLGKLSILLMLIVCVACTFAAIGLLRRAPWGIPLAVAILTINLVGDALNALVRHDLRTLIGLPIGGAMIAYLLWARRSARRGVLNQHPNNKHE